MIKFRLGNPRTPRPHPLHPFVKGGRGGLYALCALLILFVLPVGANAQGLLQGISGSLEFNYNYLTTKTTDATGNKVKTTTQTYNPRFQLDINTMIFPNLTLRAGGIAEGIKSDLKVEGSDLTTTQLNFRPYIDLTLRTPFYWASMGYERRQQRTDVTDIPATTLIRDQYYGILGMRPAGLPYMELQVRKTNSYDDDKSTLNTTEDLLTLDSKYQYKGLQLNYYGTYLHTQEKITDLDVIQYTHLGRASYSDSFFDKRLAVNTNYNILYQETTTKSGGEGVVSSQVFPIGGLSKTDDSQPLTSVTLDANPALIDGDTTTSAGINLVSDVPLVRRQMGLNFSNPTAVNQLFVWVDKELRSTLVSSFTWELFTSDDNLTWVSRPITSVNFGAFQNRFEINFLSVTTRYIKVVTTPHLRSSLVPPDPTDIFVTELQAFLLTPAATIKNKLTNTTHNYDLDVKARILDNPSLFYEFYGYFNRQDPAHDQRYTLSNAFYTLHRFNEVFSGRARVAVENGKELEDKRIAYIYDAALTADPLRTLHNSLVVNGRNEKIGGKPNDLNSIILYNTAQLYKGIDVGLSGGVNFIKQETGQSGRDFVINLQSNIVPHPALIFGLNYGNTISRRTGGDLPSSSTYTQNVDFNLSYNPFRTLNLFAFIQLIDQKGMKLQTLQNYAINWSPFPDGALQFNINYNENFRSEDHLTERIFTPSIRYNLTKRSYIQLSYQLIRSKSDVQKIDSNLIGTTLKIYY